MLQEERVLHHAWRMAVVTLASRATGYLRDKVLAWVLGAELLNDAFRTAFRIPNAFRALLAEGALHAALVPALARLADDGDAGRQARELVRGVVAALLLALAVTVGLGIVLAPWLVRLYAPGFVGDPDKLAVSVLMNRLMFPYLGLISMAALLQGVLNSRDRFLLPAATPVLFNLTVTAGAWLAAQRLSAAPLLLSTAVLAGGALQFAVQLPSVWALGFRLRPLWRGMTAPAVRGVLALMVPGIIVLGINQLNQFVTNRFASYLGDGAVTASFYAYRVTELMYGGIVIQLTTVLLPVLARQLREQPESAAATLLGTVRLVSFITLPSATLMVLVGRPVIGLLFGGGRFGPAAVAVTGATLTAYAFSVVGLGHAKVMASSFFARQNTRAPMWGSAMSLAVFVVCCWLLVDPLGVPGLGLANTVAMAVYATFLTVLYLVRYGLEGEALAPIGAAIGRQLAASAVMGLGVWLARGWLEGVVETGGWQALRVAVVFGGAAAAYLAVLIGLGGREPASLIAAVRGKGSR